MPCEIVYDKSILTKHLKHKRCFVLRRVRIHHQITCKAYMRSNESGIGRTSTIGEYDGRRCTATERTDSKPNAKERKSERERATEGCCSVLEPVVHNILC